MNRKKSDISASFPFFMNKRRWKKSQDYFKQNYRPWELSDFNWDAVLGSETKRNSSVIDCDYKHCKIEIPGPHNTVMRRNGNSQTFGLDDEDGGDGDTMHSKGVDNWLGFKLLGLTLQRAFKSFSFWKQSENQDVEIRDDELGLSPSLDSIDSRDEEFVNCEINWDNLTEIDLLTAEEHLQEIVKGNDIGRLENQKFSQIHGKSTKKIISK